MPELPFWIALAAMLVGLAGTILPAVPGIGLIWARRWYMPSSSGLPRSIP